MRYLGELADAFRNCHDYISARRAQLRRTRPGIDAVDFIVGDIGGRLLFSELKQCMFSLVNSTGRCK